jgi:hypothetical protein
LILWHFFQMPKPHKTIRIDFNDVTTSYMYPLTMHTSHNTPLNSTLTLHPAPHTSYAAPQYTNPDDTNLKFSNKMVSFHQKYPKNTQIGTNVIY